MIVRHSPHPVHCIHTPGFSDRYAERHIGHTTLVSSQISWERDSSYALRRSSSVSCLQFSSFRISSSIFRIMPRYSGVFMNAASSLLRPQRESATALSTISLARRKRFRLIGHRAPPLCDPLFPPMTTGSEESSSLAISNDLFRTFAQKSSKRLLRDVMGCCGCDCGCCGLNMMSLELVCVFFCYFFFFKNKFLVYKRVYAIKS